ncbi:MAG: L,D-transpeptidase [Coleofasciculaceae cyanobacterium]
MQQTDKEKSILHTVEQLPQSSVTLSINRTTKRLLLLQNGQIIAQYPIAIGKPGWETPPGQFAVNEMIVNPTWKHPITGELVPPGTQNPMGTHWIGFVQDNQGNKIGLHGTNDNSSIGKAASHGCLRMRNQDIGQLYDQVEIGTTVIVQ